MFEKHWLCRLWIVNLIVIMMNWLRWLYKFLGSLKFAVIVILSLAVISAVGTIIESRYNAEIAQSLVYKSPYMIVLLVALSTSLIISALHRWPWKKKHIPFLTAHVGLLILIYGSWLTMQFGIDGTLVLPYGQSNQWVALSQKELVIYASYDGTGFTDIYRNEVDFFKNPPDINLKVPEGNLKINDYIPFALRNTKIIEVDEKARGPAARFILKNANVDFTEWVLHNGRRDAELNLGPAKIILTTDMKKTADGNAIVLYSKDNQLFYKIFYENPNKQTKNGKIEEGGSVNTEWMGLEFSLVTYYPKAKEEVEFIERDYPNDLTTEAVQLEFQGKKHWVELNAMFRLFTESTAYFVTYGNKQINIGFPLRLKEFQLGKYPGTDRAASYSSLVDVEGGKKETLISMNEPLKHMGFTFYQASYKQGPSGEPTASVLSVNYDPGRILKYIGSLFVVAGAVMLFYMRKYYMRK